MRDKVVKRPGMFRPAQAPPLYRRRMQQHKNFKCVKILRHQRLAAIVKYRQPPTLYLRNINAFDIGKPQNNISGLDKFALHVFAAFKNGVGSRKEGGLPPAAVHS